MSGKYLLLRDNKQSGPYSLDDIKIMGLKKYDLVWVEGKSAAWRYPCEVDEFKSFAPQVDEQPYDRFYKKPAQQEHYQFQQSSSAQNKQQEKAPAEQKKATGKEEIRRIPPRKYVSISLPGNIRVKIEPEKKEADKKTIISKPLEKEESPSKPVLEPIFSAETKKRIPEIAAEIVSVSTAAPSASGVEAVPAKFSGNDLVQYIAFGMGILTIVMVAYLVYSSITDPLVATPPTRLTEQKPKQVTTVESTVAGQIPNAAPEEMEGDGLSAEQQTTPVPQQEKEQEPMSTLPVKKTTVVRFNDDKPQTNIQDPSSPMVKSLASKVSTSLNKYKVNVFGGLEDIRVSLQNQSSYKLDLVVVEVQYISNNNKVVKTETLRFKDVQAGESAEILAPKSSRGIKVQTHISYITSSAAGISENL
ncbi:MAG: DUF4339 domain-containing protein [Sphingobacteriales bacterium]|nr:MAG: DUF4339 domain-containing protein [Sphingobacteriales bacterium]